MDDLETRLRRLRLRPPGEELDRRVLAQRPTMATKPVTHPWWRRSIIVPWPAAAALVVVLLSLLFARMPSSLRRESPFESSGRPGGPDEPTDLAPPPGQPVRSETCLYVPGKGVIIHRVEIR